MGPWPGCCSFVVAGDESKLFCFGHRCSVLCKAATESFPALLRVPCSLYLWLIGCGQSIIQSCKRLWLPASFRSNCIIARCHLAREGATCGRQQFTIAYDSISSSHSQSSALISRRSKNVHGQSCGLVALSSVWCIADIFHSSDSHSPAENGPAYSLSQTDKWCMELARALSY